MILGAASAELVRTAWISDDAAITLRSALNLLHGFGPTFNVDERVQAYTHPLWFLLISAVSAATRNVYVSTFLLSIGSSLAVLWLVMTRIATGFWPGVLAAVVLICSKAYVDFSTSGLENPLSHVIIVGIVLLANSARERPGGRAMAAFFAACALLYLSRPDLLLLVAPLCGLIAARHRKAPGLARAVLIGAIPALLWTIFALYYYGFPFPNPAYAKLGAGIPLDERIAQGWTYLRDSFNRDVLTLSCIVGGLAVGSGSDTINRTLAAGSALYLAYVVSIGGDFMTGRFLTAPLLVAAVIVARSTLSTRHLQLAAAVVAALAVPGLDATLLSDSRVADSTIDERTGIADERAYYFQRYGLTAAPRGTFVAPAWALRGRSVSIVCGNLGFTGILGGPGAHLIDQCGLSDPLLARLPAERTGHWRIGHFLRQLPTDYEESVAQGANLLFDPATRTYYASIRRITRGPLNDAGRLREVLRMNVGKVPAPDWNMYHHTKVPRSSRAPVD